MDFGGSGAWVEWSNVNVPAQGNYELSFRYAAASSPRPCNVFVNGVSAGQVAFASTAAWTNWRTHSLVYALKAGTNTIRVEASSIAGGPNLDRLDVLSYPQVDDEASHYLNEDCRNIASKNAAMFTVPYYRLRVEYATTSDWSTLSFLQPEKVYKVRTMSTSGVATRLAVEYDRITVNQPAAYAKAGKTVTIVADYALRPTAVGTSLSLRLAKGTTGSSTIRFYAIEGGTPRLVHEVSDARPAQFQLDLSSLKNGGLMRAPIAKARRMSWALYYPWYEMRQWNSKELKDRPELPYASNDPIAIQRQIMQAKGAGIDGFISSWWGPGSVTDRNMTIILDVARQHGFYIGAFLETNSILKARNGNLAAVEDDLVRWLETFVRVRAQHPATMKVDGKPLVVPWVTCKVPVETWRNVRRRMKAHNLEATIIADCAERDYIDVLDGAIGGDANTGRVVRYHSLLSDSPSPKIWMSSAMPGFDETLLQDRTNPRRYDRENGEYFKRQLNAALEASPQWLRLYTWNEYPENTHIEPSTNWGDTYLKMTARYVLPWKCSE